MPLEIHPVVESDLPEFCRMQLASFNNGMASKLNPAPHTPETLQRFTAKSLKSFHNEADVHFLKVVDTELDGELIAGAKWRVNETARTEAQIQGMLPMPGPGDDENLAAQNFMLYLRQARRKFMGTKPFYFLHLIFTDAEHRNRGAAAMLVRWGTEKADRAQLPAYLEATEVGKPLYAKLGFEAVHEEVFDLEKYGAAGTEANTVMIREPVARQEG
ncbi:hypothetical protein BDV95DRAFT_560185 [Massariosphaeria phaeospora]|uniref:N-acetyltransferase domain-containing protein n=1 Tax=Massariosphaeria phaeospora TaxID=100035 RepID=A0A7C8ICF4_9PLEO|nr:hypothetical protein BDV95DRAFT_560185 [Massariosphaeria phaeospora]